MRHLRTSLLAVLVALLLAAAAAAWLLGTQDGARWLLSAVSRAAGVSLAAREIDGRLLGRLSVQGVRLEAAELSLAIERLDHDWQPLALLSGRIATRRFSLAGVRIQDNSPEGAPPELVWPRVPAAWWLPRGAVERLQLSDLVYRHQQSPPVVIEAIGASLAWRGGELSVTDLEAVSPEGRVAGAISAGFAKPALRLQLTATPAEPVAGMDGFAVAALLASGRDPEQLAGGFSLSGSAGGKRSLEFTGELGITRDAFRFRKLTLSRPEWRGVLAGDATVTLTAAEPLLALRMATERLSLPLGPDAPEAIRGWVTLTGTPSRYRGAVRLVSLGEGWRAAELSGSYSGNAAGVRLSPFSGSLLAGTVSGSVAVGWEGAVSLAGTLRGRDLDPALFSADWAGVVNFDLDGRLAWPEGDPPRGEVRGRLLASRLHGRALTGELQAAIGGGELRIGRLALQGKGFEIGARGTLGSRVDFEADIADLGRLLPQATGRLRADGWMRWRDGRPGGSVRIRGQKLTAAGLGLAALELAARTGEGGDEAFQAALSLRQLRYGRFFADSARIDADGTPRAHTAALWLDAPLGEARLALSGSYDGKGWSGEISDLSGRDATGPWRLDAKATLAVAKGRVALSPLVLRGLGPERLQVAAEWSAGRPGGFARVAWEALNLRRAKPWIPGTVSLEGRTTGRLGAELASGERLALQGQIALADGRLRWRLDQGELDAVLPATDWSIQWQGRIPESAAGIAAGALTLRGRARFSGGWTEGGWTLPVPRGSLTLDGDGRGLRAEIEVGLAGGGSVKGGFVSSAPARLAVPEVGSLRAEWAGIDRRHFGRWLPAGLGLDGSASGRVTGRLLPQAELDLSGQVALAGGRIRWQDEGAAIDAGLGVAELSFGWRGALSMGADAVAAGRLSATGRVAGSGRLTLGGQRLPIERATIDLDAGERGQRLRAELRLPGGGTLKGSFDSARPARLALPADGEGTFELERFDLAALRPWMPQAVGLDGSASGRVTGRLLPDRELDVAGRVALAGGRVRWQDGDEAIDAGLTAAELSFGWRGALPDRAAAIGTGRLTAAGRVAGAGQLTLDGQRLPIERATIDLDAGERGQRLRAELRLASGGTLKGSFDSARPARLARPADGEGTLEWGNLDLVVLRPWMPRELRLGGRVAGRVTGTLRPDGRLAVKGGASLDGGRIRWARPGGEIRVNARSASVTADWRGESLNGTVAIVLDGQGELGGSFRLPIPAAFPLAVDRRAPLAASLRAKVQEKGILSAIFPGVVRESRGEIDADWRVRGSWEKPSFAGSLKLAKAGGYLPAAGIHLNDLQVVMNLEREQLRIDSIRAVSGAGPIEGKALVRLDGWRVADYSGGIRGDRFRLIYLPELQVLASPSLTFQGTKERLAVRGEIQLPELLIFGPPTRDIVQTSPDVILEGAPDPVEKSPALELDVQVRLALGDRVLVKLGGIDAQFAGAIDLMFQRLDRITSKGEIRVVRGHYSAYGINLEIVRGRLFYAGGPISQPTLDILALRTVGDVRAGVTAAGILRAPSIKLYSEPAMPDVDILAYALFGRPVGRGGNSEQAGMMAQVAGVLLSKGQSVVLQEQIKNRLGLSTLELQSGGGNPAYAGARLGPAGAGAPAESVSQTMLTVGKYLTPELYFSYGRSLFTGENLFRLRYDLFRRWQIETQTGRESGVDLYFKIEFD